MWRKNLLWVGFAIFVFSAVYFSWHENIFTIRKPLDAGKFVLWAAFIAFTVYSIYCSSKENLFKTIGTMTSLHWGRQIGLDLYIGVSISVFIIYLHSGSVFVVLLWLVPLIVFANLATLLYFAINYDSIVARFFA
jgi:hypothetical protein